MQMLENPNEVIIHGYAYQDWIREISNPQVSHKFVMPQATMCASSCMSFVQNVNVYWVAIRYSCCAPACSSIAYLQHTLKWDADAWFLNMQPVASNMHKHVAYVSPHTTHLAKLESSKIISVLPTTCLLTAHERIYQLAILLHGSWQYAPVQSSQSCQSKTSSVAIQSNTALFPAHFVEVNTLTWRQESDPLSHFLDCWTQLWGNQQAKATFFSPLTCWDCRTPTGNILSGYYILTQHMLCRWTWARLAQQVV